MDKNLQHEADKGNMVKDPDSWTTGDEAMTGAQKSYLSTLCQEAKEQFDETLSKAEASKRIDELRQKTGRGVETAYASEPNSDDGNQQIEDDKFTNGIVEKDGVEINDTQQSGGRSEIPFIKADEVDETASKRQPDDGKIAAG